MQSRQKNNAYIDGANLHQGMKRLDWTLDYKKFRVWLQEKYSVHHAYVFLGLVPKNKILYTHLQECGFTLVFKEVVYDSAGKIKGNCDADLVVHTMRGAYENKFERALIVTSDGDYASLISFLIEKNKLAGILSPAIAKKCSVLLRRTEARIAYINDQRNILEVKNKRTPDEDGTS